LKLSGLGFEIFEDCPARAAADQVASPGNGASVRGPVILIPAVNRAVQQRLFKAALDELAVIGEPVNRVLEVDLDGKDVTLTFYDLPPA
jgi:hypothetical protein